MSIIKSARTRKRILTLVLILCMALALLPTGAAAGENIICAKGTLGKEHWASDITFDTEITITADLSAMTARVDFVRTNFVDNTERIKLLYPEYYERLQKIKRQTTASLTGRIEIVTESGSGHRYVSDGDAGFNYMICDFQWDGEPYWCEIHNYVCDYILITSDFDWAAIGMTYTGRIENRQVKLQTTDAVPENNKYIFGEDSYSFNNSKDSFSNASTSAAAKLAYSPSSGILSEKYYNMLISGASNSATARINSALREGFKGNCFGMSVTSALFYNGGLALSQVDAGAQNTYALAKPVSNTALRDAIAYYQLLHNYDKYTVSWNKGVARNNQTTTIKAFLDKLQASLPTPVVLGVVGDTWGHAMLAYDMVKSSSSYKVMLYDPNDYQKPVTMTIDEVNGMYLVSYSNAMYTGTKVVGNIVAGTGAFSAGSFQKALSPTEFALVPGEATVTSSDSSITIEAGGKQAVFENGEKTGGTLDASCCGPVNDIGERARFAFLVDLPNNEPVSIQTGNGSQISVQIANPNAGGSGIYVETVTESASKTTIDPSSNAVEVAGNAAGQIEISVASDQTTGELFGTTVVTTGTEVSITPTANGAAVKSEKRADVTVSGATEYVSFKGVDCDKGLTVVNSGAACTLKDADGNTIVTGEATGIGGTTTTEKPSAKPVSFSDVPSGTWYAADVRAVAEAGIFNGKGNGVFAPNDNVTLAEAVKLAAAVHAKLTGSDYDFSGASPWYQPYLDYLNQAGICPNLSGYDFSAPANRELFAKVMSGVLSAMTQSERGRNTVEDGAIPDVPNAAANKEIYALYRAGIVAGSDAKGTYKPYTSITRSEVAAIIHRFIDAGQRKSITLAANQTQGNPAASTNDGDMTGYIPDGWNWTADSAQGYGLNAFTFGKYVRSDGSAVLYVESADSPYCFKYYIYAMPDGSKSGAYTSVSTGTLSSSTQAMNKDKKISFVSNGEQITVTSDWPVGEYMLYGAPDGQYTLVRGLK